MESVDVNHSLYIPAFRIKEDVIAGRINYLTFTANQPGEYDIACAEYCGLKHSMMYTKVIVMPGEEFALWYEGDSLASRQLSLIEEESHKLLFDKGCITCHTMDGTDGIAPSFKGIFGKTIMISRNGEEMEVVIDEDYLRRAIMEPHAETVKGYTAGLMPLQVNNLNENELEEIISILKGLN
jgi:cytochrome c oxidase subunit 2